MRECFRFQAARRRYRSRPNEIFGERWRWWPMRVAAVQHIADRTKTRRRRAAPRISRNSEQRLTELLAVQRRDRVAAERMVLAAARSNLHRPQQRREPARALPIPSLPDA